MRKPQSLGAFLESRAHLLGVAFIRGESRRCKGSNEPLRRLPDGALATRRIVLVRCGAAAQSCGPVRSARGGSCAARGSHKGVQQALTCKAVQAARSAGGAFTGYRRKRVTQK